jgi:hypothetical protein
MAHLKLYNDLSAAINIYNQLVVDGGAALTQWPSDASALDEMLALENLDGVRLSLEYLNKVQAALSKRWAVLWQTIDRLGNDVVVQTTCLSHLQKLKDDAMVLYHPLHATFLSDLTSYTLKCIKVLKSQAYLAPFPSPQPPDHMQVQPHSVVPVGRLDQARVPTPIEDWDVEDFFPPFEAGGRVSPLSLDDSLEERGEDEAQAFQTLFEVNAHVNPWR